MEATGRFGGWINTTRREDGAVFEHGPRGIRPAGAVGRNTVNMVYKKTSYADEFCALIGQKVLILMSNPGLQIKNTQYSVSCLRRT